MVKVEIGEYEVYSSGSLITNDNQDTIKFYIEDLLFEFEFKDDDSVEKMHVDASGINAQKGIKLTFINFNNNLGTGNLAPIKLGTLGDKDLFMNYRIYALKGDKGFSGKTIHYSWLTKTVADESESK